MSDQPKHELAAIALNGSIEGVNRAIDCLEMLFHNAESPLLGDVQGIHPKLREALRQLMAARDNQIVRAEA